MNPLFGTKHLILIAVSFALIVGVSFLIRKWKLERVCKSLFIVGILSETVKIFYYIIINEDTHAGLLPKTDLPFHLCSIQILFIAVVVMAKSEKLRRFLLSFMMPSCLCGGICAILIATDSSRNDSLYIITTQYFLYHVAITAFAIYLMRSKELQLSIADYANCLKFLVVLMFFAIYINSVVSSDSVTTNFMYVVAPPQEGLPFLNKDHGWFVYMVHYAFTVVFAVSACYCKPIYTAIKTKLTAKKSAVPTALAEVAPTTDETDQTEND